MSRTDVAFQADDTLPDCVPVWRDFPFRIAMTTSCRDCAHLPKVAGAGTVVEENSQRVQIMHNGVRVIAGGYDGDWMMEIIKRLKGHHEPQEELVFHQILETLPEQATMIELGGYWSYYTLWFLHSAPQHRRAIVIEPDPRFLDVGRMNAALNGREIDFIQACVGEVPADQIEFPSQSSGPVLIPQVTIASLMASRNIPCLDILHCDTQGAEMAVIKSCATLFQENRIRFGIFSTHDKQFTDDPLTHQRCLAMIKAHGGQILAEHEVHESFSGDGLIVAYFGSTPLDWMAPNISYNRYSNCLFRNPIYDIADAKRIEAEKNELESDLKALTEEYDQLREDYAKGGKRTSDQAALVQKCHEIFSACRAKVGVRRSYFDKQPDLDETLIELYDTFRLTQRRPIRLLRSNLKWRVTRFFLRFAPLLPEALVQRMRRRMRKHQPLPRLTDLCEAGTPQQLSDWMDPLPNAICRFLTEKTYRKRTTSKFLLLFSPVLSRRLQHRLHRRYEKSSECGQLLQDALVIPAEDAHTSEPKQTVVPQLTESAQRFFEELEARLASMPSERAAK